MKRVVSFIFTCTLLTSALAQESEKMTDDGNHELKLNFGYLIFEILEINYEYILTEEFSVGVGANYWLAEGEYGVGINYWYAEGDYIDYMINPYFRFYPINSRRRAATFFIEGNAGIIGGRDYRWIRRGAVVEEEFIRGGAGVATGVKFLSKNNFVGEGYLGIGRVFGSQRYAVFYPRAGITFGKRF